MEMLAYTRFTWSTHDASPLLGLGMKMSLILINLEVKKQKGPAPLTENRAFI